MGNTLSIKKINCEDMQKACNGSSADNYMIINTLEDNMQKCLIKNTIQIHEEEKIINSIIKKNRNKVRLYQRLYIRRRNVRMVIITRYIWE